MKRNIIGHLIKYEYILAPILYRFEQKYNFYQFVAVIQDDVIVGKVKQKPRSYRL